MHGTNQVLNNEGKQFFLAQGIIFSYMQNNLFTLSSWHTFSQIIAAFQHIFCES